MIKFHKLHTIEEQISPIGIDGCIRLDRYVSENLKVLSRSQIKARSLKAKVNGKDVKLSRLVKQGDVLELSWDNPPEYLVPQNIPLDIIHEDDRQVVVNKAQGMVVHPGAGNRLDTLANALLFRGFSGGAGFRPGIVHRLDKETSGVIIAAYNDEVHAFLAEQFKTRKVKKTYIAIVTGTLKEENGRIETFISRDIRDRKRFAVSAKGKIAITYYKVLKNWQNYSLVLLRPRTGRTHQLRVHMKYLGHPVLGDSVYNSKDKYFPDATLMLHSKSLNINLYGETEKRLFTSPMPERFITVINNLNGSSKELEIGSAIYS